MALTCNKMAELDFSTTLTIPKEFEYIDGSKFSIAISKDNLMVYKNIVEEIIPSADVICNKTISDLKLKLAQVNVSGYIYFRVAVDGLKSDEFIINPSISQNVTIEPAWSSADGIVSIKDVDNNNYMTIAYIPVDQELTDMPIEVSLQDIEIGNISADPNSENKTLRINGKFKLTYTA